VLSCPAILESRDSSGFLYILLACMKSSIHSCFVVLINLLLRKTNVRTRHHCRWSKAGWKPLATGNLPPDLPAAIFVVLHIPAHSECSGILNRSVQKQGASLQAKHAQEGEEIVHGRTWHLNLLVKKRGAVPKKQPSTCDPFHGSTGILGDSVMYSRWHCGSGGEEARRRGCVQDPGGFIPECPRAQ